MEKQKIVLTVLLIALNSKMKSALQILDKEDREDIYRSIQWYLVEELYPITYICHPKLFFVHSADRYGVSFNAMERFEAYGI